MAETTKVNNVCNVFALANNMFARNFACKRCGSPSALSNEHRRRRCRLVPRISFHSQRRVTRKPQYNIATTTNNLPYDHI